MALSLGTSAPDFSLPAIDGKTYSLGDFQDRKALLVMFICNHCPYVKAYIGRLIELQADYASKGVAFVAINSNETKNYPEDRFEKMVEWAREKRFNFPYLRDETQEVARAYEATHTPHLFLFDEDRKLVYTGTVDDNYQDPKRVKRRYLKEAMEQVLARQKVAQAATHAIGCTIKWR